MRVRIGTRGSALARVQAEDVARRLHELGHQTEILVMDTAGDRATDRAFADIGAFGIFVREIENALLDDRVDVAVHSYKDLPSQSPDGLAIAAMPERVDVADVLLIRRDMCDASGAAGAVPVRVGACVGTSAARRAAFLRAMRPDIDIAMLRGNVPTRIRALEEGRFDAIVLAAAGLLRLERTVASVLVLPATLVRVRLDPERFVPAPAQGALAVQVRADDARTRTAVAPLDDPTVARAIRAERAVLALAEGGCTLPLGAWCRNEGGDHLRLFAALGAEDGSVRRAEVRGDDPERLAADAWQALSETFAGRPS